MTTDEQNKNSFVVDWTLIIDLMIIISVWCFAIVVISPIGNFPLNDDWNYAVSVKNMLEEGRFHPTTWTTMSLYTHTLWGTLVSKIFGFSYTVLRFSNLFLSLISLVTIYFIFREVTQRRWLPLISALTIGLNPIFFALSYTFMTDPFFNAMISLSILFFIKNIKNDSSWYLLLAIIFSVIAILCRQVGLFIPAAYGLTVVILNGFTINNLVRAGLPAVACMGSLLFYNWWIELEGVRPSYYGMQINNLFSLDKPERLIIKPLRSTLKTVAYIGLFIMPLLILLNSMKAINKKTGQYVTKTTAFFFLLLVAMVATGNLMPLVGNIMIEQGIGPLTLHDMQNLQLSNLPALPYAFWLVVTVVSVFAARIFLSHFILAVKNIISDYKNDGRNKDLGLRLFFLSLIVVYFLPISLIDIFDRYLIPLLLPVLALMIMTKTGNMEPHTKTKIVVPSIIIFIMAGYSILGIHDYLSWNKARWIALDELVSSDKVETTSIDGGYEFNGLYAPKEIPKNTDKSKAWWWLISDDEYLVSFGEVPGYNVFREYKYQKWLPYKTSKIFILKRDGASDGKTK